MCVENCASCTACKEKNNLNLEINAYKKLFFADSVILDANSKTLISFEIDLINSNDVSLSNKYFLFIFI
jgi:hypothetical protein